ncbi:MAG: class II fructose-bisphosphatase [Anaerolineae bacterium]
MQTPPDRNIALELVRVTESAAMSAARWMGRGDKNNADKAAVDAMRLMLSSLYMDGIVVIGEGEKDKAPMLYNGERIGVTQAGITEVEENVPQIDLAVDPIDGTRLLSKGLPNALSVVTLAERGSMFNPGPIVYMDKIAVGPEARGVIDLDAPVEDNLHKIAKALGKDTCELTVVILERPRHDKLIEEVRACCARLKLITDGDVAGAISTALEETGVDVLMGIGGSPEAVITAGALQCLGGEIQARLYPRDEVEERRALEMGYDLKRVFNSQDLVHSDNIFFSATGITDGEMLEGVHYHAKYVTTHSLVLRSKSGTIRYIQSTHPIDKVNEILS